MDFLVARCLDALEHLDLATESDEHGGRVGRHRPVCATRAADCGRRSPTNTTSTSHELALLVEAVRTVDLLDELESRVRADGAVIQSPQGLKAHPAAVEARQQRIALARILAALRMPAGDEGVQVQGRRPQRRTGVRGVHGIRGVVAS